MKIVRVMQQALDPTGYGGVSVEYRALCKANLSNEYEFIPLILKEFHTGINLHDITFYYRKIKECKPDIVQIRGAGPDGLNAVIATKLVKGPKALLCIHGLYSDFIYYNVFKRMIAKYIIEPLSFNLVDGISCVYENCSSRPNFKRYARKMLPYIYNRMPKFDDIDLLDTREKMRNHYDIPDDAVVALFCGRVTREKGLEYLKEGLALLKNQWPSYFHVIIVGDGDYLETLKNEVSFDIGLSKYVHFTGSIENVAPILSSADYFIMPSLHENHSIALLEALSLKLPCIATSVGGNLETLKNGKFGILIPPYNSESIRNAILAMNNSDLRNFYRFEIEKYDFYEFSDAAINNQLKLVYKTLLGK